MAIGLETNSNQNLKCFITHMYLWIFMNIYLFIQKVFFCCSNSKESDSFKIWDIPLLNYSIEVFRTNEILNIFTFF